MENQMDKATPRPWRIYTKEATNNEVFYIDQDDGSPFVDPLEIATVYKGGKSSGVQQANAELICRAVNLHDELVEFIENLENDDNSIPGKIWEWRNSLLQKAKAAK